jgi:hypothetical protein
MQVGLEAEKARVPVGMAVSIALVCATADIRRQLERLSGPPTFFYIPD